MHVLVESLNADDEHEVVVSIAGAPLRCFVSCCPFRIHVGERYKAEFVTNVWENYEVTEGVVGLTAVRHVGTGYSYLLFGVLRSGIVECGLPLAPDPILLADFGRLDGKPVVSKVDRLDISFT